MKRKHTTPPAHTGMMLLSFWLRLKKMFQRKEALFLLEKKKQMVRLIISLFRPHTYTLLVLLRRRNNISLFRFLSHCVLLNIAFIIPTVPLSLPLSWTNPILMRRCGSPAGINFITRYIAFKCRQVEPSSFLARTSPVL